MSQNQETSVKKKSGICYALYRCGVEWSLAPIANYAEGEGDAMKYMFKNAPGVLILLLLIASVCCICFYRIGWHRGWSDYESATGDALLKELKPLPQAERAKIYAKQFSDSDGDSSALSFYGMEAFRAGDFEWSAKFFERSDHYIVDDGVEMDYPCYAADLFNLHRSREAEAKLNQLIHDIDRDIENHNAGNQHLGNIETFGAIGSRIVEAKSVLSGTDKQKLDAFLNEINTRIDEVKSHAP